MATTMADMSVTMQGPQCPLQNRVLFHCAHKTGQEERLMEFHAQLTDSLEDQLSLASIHYLRGHYQVLKPSKALLTRLHQKFIRRVWWGFCKCSASRPTGRPHKMINLMCICMDSYVMQSMLRCCGTLRYVIKLPCALAAHKTSLQHAALHIHA